MAETYRRCPRTHRDTHHPGARGVPWSTVLTWLTEWWDDVELWLAQLWFPFQVTLTMVVLLPVCWFVAWLIDRVVDRTSAAITRTGETEPPLGGSYDAPPTERGEPGRAADRS
ncbi:hypothetical protein GCM10012275_25230 [Longimycelium tulufanense]|uniref:Uncharacterized protein n=1 Tax=Longimycelium tulufanense TaxID=907463 RepID=A0A8J3CEB8_9PSEU|nr:hypothetical protein [Longimycelium tulufanense]GGM53184.1 hypothetical protein GCM10012275_25230 [Longimycelium tulufanense]